MPFWAIEKSTETLKKQAAAVNWKSFTQKIPLNCTSLKAVDRLLSTLGNVHFWQLTGKCHHSSMLLLPPLLFPVNADLLHFSDLLIINSQLICTNAWWCVAYLCSFILCLCVSLHCSVMLVESIGVRWWPTLVGKRSHVYLGKSSSHQEEYALSTALT